MTTKRNLVLGLLAAGAGLATLSPAQAATEAEAATALQAWTDAVFTGDPAIIEKTLAPEFQILRSDGNGYTKAEYLQNLPKQKSKSTSTDLVVTSHGDLIVIRYIIHTNQTINNKPVESIAPRLSVFRKEAGAWLIVAHSNFSKIG